MIELTWYQIWTVSWQVAVFLTPMLVGIAVLWLRSQFVTKADAVIEKNRVDAAFSASTVAARTETIRVDAEFRRQEDERDTRWEKVREGLADHEGRLRSAEADLARPPSRHTLNNAISVMQGGLHSLERGVDDMRRQMDAQNADMRRQMETLNGYLHTMIEKHLS